MSDPSGGTAPRRVVSARELAIYLSIYRRYNGLLHLCLNIEPSERPLFREKVFVPSTAPPPPHGTSKRRRCPSACMHSFARRRAR